jgi:hypothetical protein
MKEKASAAWLQLMKKPAKELPVQEAKLHMAEAEGQRTVKLAAHSEPRLKW